MKRKRLLGGLLALLMLFNIGSAFPVGVWGDDPPTTLVLDPSKDKSGEFDPETIIISQDGIPLDEENNTIDFTKAIKLAFEFGVPHTTDINGNPVFKIDEGDYFKFDISNLLNVPASTPIPLLADVDGTDVRVATAHFIKDPGTGMLSVAVIFDNPEIFDKDNGYFNAKGSLDVTLSFDGSTSGGVGEEEVIEILNRSYTRAKADREYGIKKSSVNFFYGNQEIEWEIEVTATKKGPFTNPHDVLTGLTFSDNFTANAGGYVPGSFKISSTKDGTYTDPAAPWTDFAAGITSISYAFPDGTQSPQYIRFKTKTTDDVFIKGGKVENTAKLMGTGVNKTSNKVTETYPTRTWIEKDGVNSDQTGVYDPTNRTITWTITINKQNALLNDVKIIDALPTGTPALEFKSAIWSGGGIPDKNWPPLITTGDEYEIGDINSVGTLTIVHKVPDSVGPVIGVTNYKNTAKLTVGGKDYGTATKDIGVGYAGFTKTAANANLSDGTIKWTVNFDPKGQALTNIKIYDLFVYGNSGLDLDSLDKSALEVDFPGFKFSDLDPVLYQNLNQKLITPLDFTIPTGKTDLPANSWKVYTLTDGTPENKPVADLLIITVPDQAAGGSNNYSFSFTSKVTDPKIYAANNPTGHTVRNTAHLYSTQVKMPATAYSRYVGSTLIKDGDPFNYADKTITYRLLVNKNGINFSTINDGNPLTPLTLKDTIDAGWNIIGFKLHNVAANSSVGSEVADPSSIVEMGAQQTDATGTTVEFTFKKLEQPYYIVVTAKLSDAKAEEIFSKNQKVTVNNLAEFFWGTEKLSWDDHDTDITSKILDKAADLSKADDEGYITWTVDYNPYSHGAAGERIVDTLYSGLDLPTDSMGNLDMSYIHVYPLTMQADGTLTQGSSISLTLGTDIVYDKDARTLTFNIPDKDQAYRLVYVTNITGNSGDVLNNEVKLMSGKNDGNSEEVNYTVTDKAAKATIERGGSLIIDKRDNAGGLLALAEFTLFASDNATVVRKGLSSATGELAFRAIPTGTYYLRETGVPAGYEPPDDPIRTYKVTVDKEGTTIVTKIDDADTAPGSKMTVTNYLYGTTGSLIISKSASGYYPEGASKTFSFKVELTEPAGPSGTYHYVGYAGAASGDISSGGTVTLKSGQSIAILDLPKDTIFKVTELNGADEYIETSQTIGGVIKEGEVAEGTIIAGQNQLTFNNVRDTGHLTLTKVTKGHFTDSGKKFKFTLTLREKASDDLLKGSYDYDGDYSGTITGGSAEFNLAGGESVTVHQLPAGARYSINEDDSTKYVVTTNDSGSGKNAAGAIPGNEDTKDITFTNTRDTGHLTLSKIVVGNLPDPDKKFKFTLYLMESDGTTPHIGNYDYIGSGGASNGTITSDVTAFELSNGQSVTIQHIPKDIKYTIDEDDYNGERITTTHSINGGTAVTGLKAEGEIKALPDSNTAAFTNTRRSGTIPTDPWTPTQPTTTPTEPTETTGPTEGPTEPTESTEPTDTTGPTEPTETTAPTEPTYPTIPTENVPDPNNPDSPDDFILIDENGTPQGRYTKAPQPDGSFVYLDENGIPLGQRPIPRTGDQSNLILWAIVLTLSLAGAGWLLLPQFSLGRRKH